MRAPVERIFATYLIETPLEVVKAAASLAGEPSLVARLVGMSERIESVAFSPDGAALAVAGGSPG